MACIQYERRNFSDGSLDIIREANAICREYARQGYDLTLRQLFYQFVSRDLIANKQTEYKRLGSIVNDARLAGWMDWDYIVDRTRNLRSLAHWDSPADLVRTAAEQFRTDKWATQPTRVECWVEKDALVGVLESCCPGEDVPFFSCRGYTSQSEVWGAAQRLGGYISNGQKVAVIHLGDHDPSGIDMTRDIEDRLVKFIAHDLDLVNMGDDAETCSYELSDRFEIQRIALNMDQVRRYNPPPNPAKLALALDTLLPTPSGWTTMGEIRVGGRLFGSDGRPYTVTSKSPTFTDKKCLRFTFAGGEQITCSDDHLWTVKARKRRGGTMSAAEIAATWVEGADDRPVYKVQMAAALDLPAADLPIPPYVLGAWLGDGNTDAEGFACSVEDGEILGFIETEGFRTTRRKNYPVSCYVYGLRGKLYSLGVAHNKHIPPAYLRASHAQRLALLQGLMDTDGSVSTNRGMVPCFYGSSRETLAQDVLELVCSLGFRGRTSESRAVFEGRDYGPTWKVEFYPGDTDVFRLPRKRARLVGSRVAERQRWRTITNVERVAGVETQCLSINSPDHLYLAGRHFIPTHNSDARASGYIARYGVSSWELDALDPTTIVDLIRSAIDGYRDHDAWENACTVESGEREVLTATHERWDDVKVMLAS